MIIEEPIAPLALHHLGQSGTRPALVVIGAMDGISFDGLAEFITTYRWPGLFVEPIREQFRRLWARYAKLGFADVNRYENSAIADDDGTVQMLTIRQDVIDAGTVPPCFGGMSTIWPPRNGLASAEDAAVVEAYGELVEVACITLPTLFRRHAVSRVDILCIDAEGWDYRILTQLDFAMYRPKFLRYEWVSLTRDEQNQLEALLERHRYVACVVGQNVDAVPAEYWAELRALPERPEPPAMRARSPSIEPAQ